MSSIFDLSNKVVLITGGAGLLGRQHASAVAEFGGVPVLLDVDLKAAEDVKKEIAEKFCISALAVRADVSDEKSLNLARDQILDKYSRIDALINNAALDPKIKKSEENTCLNRLESFSLDQWNAELAVGLTGAFLSAKVFGTHMAGRGGGVIVNVSSDLGILAPDQRLYRKDDLEEDQQPVKPVTYSVIKHALIGLTKYLSTYWTEQKIRVNTLCPAGVENNQPEEFLDKIQTCIPMGRMAKVNEYKGAIVFLCSEASSYMTGGTLVVDGGRSAW